MDSRVFLVAVIRLKGLHRSGRPLHCGLCGEREKVRLRGLMTADRAENFLAGGAPRYAQIVFGLEIQPGFGLCFEVSCETESRVGRNGTRPVDDGMNAIWRDTEFAG